MATRRRSTFSATRFGRRRSAGKNPRLQWFDGVTSTNRTITAPNASTSTILVASNNSAIDIRGYTLMRIVGEVWTGIEGRPALTNNTVTEMFMYLSVYLRRQDAANTQTIPLDMFVSDDRMSKDILWTRYDYLHFVGDGSFANDVGAQSGPSAHVDIKVKRKIHQPDVDLVLDVRNSVNSDQAMWSVDNLRVLLWLP